jgi:hypothetical protein
MHVMCRMRRRIHACHVACVILVEVLRTHWEHIGNTLVILVAVLCERDSQCYTHTHTHTLRLHTHTHTHTHKHTHTFASVTASTKQKVCIQIRC